MDLLGGAPETRVLHRRRPDIEHAKFLNPVALPLDVEALRRFQARGKLAVEVGFGKGRFLSEFAGMHPDWRMLGFEVRRKLCLCALERLDVGGLDNGRVLLGDARFLLPRHIDEGRISAVFVLFPDPWWKKKHHRRRLLDAAFLRLLQPLLAKEALFVVRSDVPMVMDLASRAFAEAGRFTAQEGAGMELPETAREVVCRRAGIPVHEQCYRFEPGGSPGSNTSET